VALVGCTTTEVVSIDLRNVRLMVVGLAAVPENRIKFEDVLAAKLNAAGISALASHPIVPVFDDDARESIREAAEGAGVTSIIIVAPVRVGDDGGLAPIGPELPQGADLSEFVDWGLRSATLERGQVAFATNVYQLSSGKLIWGGVSWPFAIESVDAVLEETATVIAENVIAAERQLLQLRERGIEPSG
jgi:hypothetical protein